MPEPVEAALGGLNVSVSRETLQRLETHHALLEKWNPAINLVAKGTLSDGWARHILDSAQVFTAISNPSGHWLDFGTGGGFPGIVCAILAREMAPGIRFTFVESDKRKVVFLATVLREVGVDAALKTQRIESLEPQSADIISARAVAALPKLLEYSEPHLSPAGRCVFPKGERYPQEIVAAHDGWCFNWEAKPSITEPKAVILVLGEIERV